MTDSQQPEYDPSQGNDFKLERYKYILHQISFLNENIFKFIGLFQTLGTVIISAQIAVFLSWRKLEISADIARIGIQSLLLLLVFIALFSIVSIVVGVASWFDYRKEEVELLNKTVAIGFRKQPRLGNLWRWYETYIVLLIVLIIIFTYLVVQTQIIPLIK